MIIIEHNGVDIFVPDDKNVSGKSIGDFSYYALKLCELMPNCKPTIFFTYNTLEIRSVRTDEVMRISLDEDLIRTVIKTIKEYQKFFPVDEFLVKNHKEDK